MHRLVSRGLTPFVLLTAVVLISGCGTASAANTPSSGSTPMPPTATATPTPLIEHLVFQGDISGTIITALDPRPLTHDNPLPDFVQQPDGTYFAPPPRWTQCSTFDSIGSGTIDDSLAVIVGEAGTHRYVVTIEINMADAAYTKPGTALYPGDINSGGSVEVYEVGGHNRRWVQVYGPASQEPVIVLHADRKSGSVDAWMATTDQSQKDAAATHHLQGDWRCG